GHLWITDFGLASTRKDTGLTVTGDLVGTLRYMSPEQARGKRVPVDHRSDIYSLAVTLYELLTLRQAFPGDDQAAIMQDIVLREPARPRALNPATPAELETILRKAMAKEPADRYATAQELADDLRRFIEDRPIHARRPSALKRAVQWSRRHTAVLWATGAVLVLAIAGLIAGNLVIANERDQAEENFEKMRDLVDSMLTRVAEELQDQPRMEQLRRELLEEALAFYLDFLEQKGDEPTVRLDVGRAYKRVGLIYDNLGQYANSEATTKRAIAAFEELATDSPDVLPLQSELASAVVQLGGLYDDWDRSELAVAALRRALALWETVLRTSESRHEPDPRVPGHFIRHQIVRCSTALGSLLYYKTAGPDEALVVFERASEISEELAREHPGKYRGVLVGTLLEVGQVLMSQRRFEEAEKTLRRCRAVAQDSVREDPSPRNRIALSQCWHALALVLDSMDRLVEAEQALNEALPIQRELARDFPSMHKYRFELSDTYFVLGDLRLQRKRADGSSGLAENAQQACLSAQTILRELVDKHPKIPTYRFRLARTHLLLASILDHAGQQERAKEETERAVDLLDELESEMGTQYEYRGTRAQACNNLCAYLEKSDPQRAEQLLERCIAMNRALVRDYPEHPRHQHELSIALTDLAHVFLRPAKRNDEAEKAFLDAVDFGRALVDKYPETPDYRHSLIRTHFRFAGFCAGAGNFRTAAREYRSANALALNHPNLLNSLAWLLATCPDPAVGDPREAIELAQRAIDHAPKVGAIWNTLGVAQYRAGELKAAVKALERSMDLQSGGSAWDWLFLAMAHSRLGGKKEARTWYAKALAWIQKHAPDDAELASLRTEAAALLVEPD
ncbi:MAG: protein kinase domain-containing protein, partial [Planctomycetota bacterium]